MEWKEKIVDRDGMDEKEILVKRGKELVLELERWEAEVGDCDGMMGEACEVRAVGTLKQKC